MTSDDLVIIGANIEFDGNGDIDRHNRAHRALREHGPSVIFRQECKHTDEYDRPFLHTAARMLDMEYVIAPMKGSTNRPGLLVDSGIFQIVPGKVNFMPAPSTKPPASAIFRMVEAGTSGRQVMMGSFHASYCSVTERSTDAEDLTRFADQIRDMNLSDGSTRWGSNVWLQMDANSYRVQEGNPHKNPDPSEIEDKPHIVHRTRWNPVTGMWEPDIYLDETLLRAGLHDPARYAYHVLGRKQAMDPTAGHLAQGQGASRGIDRFYLDAWSVQAVKDVEVIDMSRFSDHHAVKVVFSREMLASAVRRDFDPLPGYPANLSYA